MSKKFRITEEQLKRLVVNNKNIQEETDMNEIGVGSVEMGLAKEIAPVVVAMLKVEGKMEGLSMDIFLRALRHEIENYKPESEEKDEEGENEDNDEMERSDSDDKEEEKDKEDDNMMNESVKGYKTEFERYLKSPKQ